MSWAVDVQECAAEPSAAAGCNPGAGTSGYAVSLKNARRLLRELPPKDWVQGQVGGNRGLPNGTASNASSTAA